MKTKNKGGLRQNISLFNVKKEAHTRETAVIDAIGVLMLINLFNKNRGTYYDNIKRWRNNDWRKLEFHSLCRIMFVFLGEGERQLFRFFESSIE